MWTEGIAVVFADTFIANVISWRLGRRVRSADGISAYVCGSFDKVGQENPLLCPRLQYSPGHWCWWHQINTWLTAEYHHRSFSISLFHVQTYSTHTYSMCTHAGLFVVRFTLMSFYKHSVPRACQTCGDESAGSWWEALNLVHGPTGATLELHARWHILIFIFSALQHGAQTVAVYSHETLTHGELWLTGESGCSLVCWHLKHGKNVHLHTQIMKVRMMAKHRKMRPAIFVSLFLPQLRLW